MTPTPPPPISLPVQAPAAPSPQSTEGAAGPPSFEAPTFEAAARVLKSVGWPQDVVVLDFETYFSKTYHMGKKKGSLSTIEYIMDSRYEALGVACLTISADQPFAPRVATFWHDVEEQLSWLQRKYGENLERATVVAHNARFDSSILVRKHGLVPPYVVDTLALSRHLDARNQHGLAVLCERHGLQAKGDTMQFEGLRWADMSREQTTALSEYACNDAEREADLLCLLLPRLTRPEVELPLQRHTLRLFWEPELAFDFGEAKRLVGLMEAQVAKDTEPVGATPAEISGNTSFVTLLAAALAESGEAVPMKLGKKGMIAALAKTDTAVEDLKHHHNPHVRALIRARQAVKSWPLHVKRLRAMADQARAAGGKLPNPLNYYGAHTGRWSGGEGINTCNLPTRGKGLQVEMKHCLVAPPGMALVMADSAQIEARGVAWVAGQENLLEAFRQNRDVYSEFVEKNLAMPCRKPRKSDPPPVYALYSVRRATGKVPILGAGYGMGAARCYEYMESYPELLPKIDSGEIDLAFCKRLIDAYRTEYRMIPKLWRDLENVFRYTTKYSQPQTLHGLVLSREGSTTIIRLPSGRCLFYPHASIGRDDRIVWRWGDLWGGSLVENVVQSISRDVLAEAILFVEDHGFRVAHHVYDSILVCVPEAKAQEALACVETALTRVPEWANGWPLGVEASIAKRYE
jgi:DNA polymerase